MADIVTRLKLMKEICLDSYPFMFFYICLFNQQSINLIFISQKYDDYRLLEAIGISHLYLSITATIVVNGLISGLDVLASNAVGSKNYHLMGLYVHRANLISYIYLIFISCINYYFAIEILTFFRIDPSILDIVKIYLRLISIILFLDIPFESNFRIINIFQRSYVNTVIITISFFLHFLWCYIFINVFDLGINGAAFSLIISKSINLILTEIYLRYYSPHPESKFSFCIDSFKGWYEYLEIALPTTLLLFGNRMCFEIQALFSIYLSDVDYSVHIILVVIEDFFFSLPFSFGTISCMKLAKGLIDQSVEVVKETFQMGFILVNINSIFICVLIKIFENSIVSMFLSDPIISSKTLQTIYPLILFCLFNCGYHFTFFCLRGISSINTTVRLSLINGYIVTPIMTYILAYYYRMGVYGVWLAMAFGRLWLFIFVYYFISTVDLKLLKKITIERTGQHIEQITENKLKNI